MADIAPVSQALEAGGGDTARAITKVWPASVGIADFVRTQRFLVCTVIFVRDLLKKACHG